MNNEKLLRTFIKEQLSAADAEKLVGKYLWPLKSKNPPKGKDDPRYEQDTPEEEALYQQFLGFVINHQKTPMTAKALKTIYDLISTGRYSDTLPKTPKKPVYRGMSVGLSWFKRNFGVSYEDFVKQSETMKKPPEVDDARGAYYYYSVDEGSRDITPPGEAVMSWSKSFGQAGMFAEGSGASGANYNVPVIFQAIPAENQMVDIAFIYRLQHDYFGQEFMQGRSSEQEVLSLGPVVVSKVYCGVWKYREGGRLTPEQWVSAERDPTRKRVQGLPDKIVATPEETDADFEKLGYQDIPRRK